MPDASSPVLLGLGVAALAVLQVLVLAAMNGWMAARKDMRDANRALTANTEAAKIRKQEREDDYARQDLVADRVAAAARQARDAATLLLGAQQDTVAATQEVARLKVVSDAQITAHLQTIEDGNRKIHALVNSDMTAARTAERDAVKLTLLALRKVQVLSTNLGIPTTPAELDAIVAAEERVAELDRILADRLAAQHALDAEKENSAIAPPST